MSLSELGGTGITAEMLEALVLYKYNVYTMDDLVGWEPDAVRTLGKMMTTDRRIFILASILMVNPVNPTERKWVEKTLEFTGVFGVRCPKDWAEKITRVATNAVDALYTDIFSNVYNEFMNIDPNEADIMYDKDDVLMRAAEVAIKGLASSKDLRERKFPPIVDDSGLITFRRHGGHDIRSAYPNVDGHDKIVQIAYTVLNKPDIYYDVGSVEGAPASRIIVSPAEVLGRRWYQEEPEPAE